MTTLCGRCPKCQGNLFDDHGTIKCLQCGWEKVGARERQLFYQANEADMVRDLVNLGKTKTLAKWGIKPQHISHLKMSALYKERTSHKVEADGQTDGKRPELPAFSDSWDPQVQLKQILPSSLLSKPRLFQDFLHCKVPNAVQASWLQKDETIELF